MKRLTTALLVAAVAGLVALPRAAAADDSIKFGVKIGGNMARPTGLDARDPLATLKFRAGLNGGVFMDLNFGRYITVRSEVLYTMKGASYAALDDSYTAKLLAGYIEVPLLLVVKNPEGRVQPFVFAGSTVGFKVHEKLASTGGPLDGRMLKDSDYGAIFGIGLSVDRFVFDLRYNLGVQKVIAYYQGEIEPDFKNGVWSASVGIVF
jgi:hypothetical protein